MSPNSGLSDAPPTRKPSMSGHADSSGAFLALAEPPYCTHNTRYDVSIMSGGRAVPDSLKDVRCRSDCTV
eukprot:3309453-Rhodomonas_salina.7